jgi:DNA polymerase-3 subunit gamma/tau
MGKRKTAAVRASASPAAGDEYTVLARRYRPQQFADLVGQEPVAQALANALQSNRVAHAYLFTGARGVGKTSTARILAKALNCVNGPTTTPCNQCELCRSIATGEDVDVLEIDGASNRGIDEVREIRQNVQYRPSRARYKIYIIDEVHMLTPPAFNALLKTLEEPPPHVKFIFATTEVQKIPVTILSRCQRFDFAGIGTSQIVARLKQIVANEGVQADNEALELVARRAGGSMRDAQSLLDQLLAFGGERLTVDQVHGLLGTAHEDRVVALAGAVLGRDAKKALELLGEAADQGLQLGELLDQLIDYWRDLMVVNCAGLENQTLSVSRAHREIVEAQARKLGADTILAGLDVLVSAKGKLRNSAFGRVLLEMALVRLSRLDDLVSLSQLATLLSSEGHGGASFPVPVSRAASPTPRIVEAPEAEKKKAAAGADVISAIPLTAETVRLVWSKVLAGAGPLLANELGKAADVAISGPNTLVLRFPPGYNRDGNEYLDPMRVGRIEDMLRVITGHACTLRIEASGGEASEDSSTAVCESPEPSPSRNRRLRIEGVPLVTRAMEVLGAQVVQMDDDFGAAEPSALPSPARPPADEAEEP